MTSLPRSKGNRPIFLGSPVADDLLAIVMALVGELAVLRERVDTMEHLLGDKGVLDGGAIDAYAPDQATEEARETWRRAYLDRVLYALKSRADETAQGETLAAYRAVVEEIGS